MSLLTRFSAFTAARVLVVAGALATAASCGESSEAVSMGPSIMLTPPSATISVGDSVVFRATTADPPTYRWTTGSPTVAAVSSTGVVRGLAPGRSTVTVVWVDHPGVAASGTVDVRAP
jgi:uncharacterized protein YjdB